jgi:hypothetical protein
VDELERDLGLKTLEAATLDHVVDDEPGVHGGDRDAGLGIELVEQIGDGRLRDLERLLRADAAHDRDVFGVRRHRHVELVGNAAHARGVD